MKAAKIRLLTIVAASLAASQFALAADAADKDGNTRGEAELAKLLEGRTAGKPVNCLSDSQRDRMQTIDGTAFVFRDGKTIYVNRPEGARFIDEFDYPVFKIFGGRLCRRDQVRMQGWTSSIPGPVMLLGQFVPYRLVEDEKSAEPENKGN